MARALFAVTLLGWCLALAGPLALAVLLLVVAETARGHAFGLVAVFVATGPAVWLFGALLRRTALRWAGLAACGVAVLGTLGLWWAVPGEERPHGAGAWSEGTTVLGLATLLPEIDQLVLGSYLVGFVDPHITVASSRHVREVFLSVYRPLAKDRDFAALPTQLSEVYEDGAHDQRFVYVPEHAPGERLPCVVFLHGSLGNFQGYLWVWKQLADRGHFVVVAPGFGLGNWQKRGGVEAVLAARREAERTLPVDPDRFVLAGLSNGGRGVMRVIEGDEARRWKAVVLLSAVVDVEPSRDAWRGRPTLVVHGQQDDRISQRWAEYGVDLLRGAGAPVELRTDPAEDHFLFFAQPEEMADWVLPFLARTVGTTAAAPHASRPRTRPAATRPSSPSPAARPSPR